MSILEENEQEGNLEDYGLEASRPSQLVLLTSLKLDKQVGRKRDERYLTL